METWKETKISINRSSWNDQKTFNEYLTFLEQSIAPAIKELREKKLIDCYNFVAHATLDLRLSIVNETTEGKVGKIINKYIKQVRTPFAPYTEGRKHLLAALEIISDLNLKEIESRQAQDIKEFHAELIHFANLSIGMTNQDEAHFYLDRATVWILQCYVENYKQQGFGEDEAKQKVVNHIKALLFEQ